MKYLYTVLDRKKQGNSSVYLVRNLRTKEEKVVPIDWIRKQYPKGVISNISISDVGKINIVKDKAIKSDNHLCSLFKKVKIIEFIEDAQLDGLSFVNRDGYAIKEIEVLKEKFITYDLMQCVKLTDESESFINNTKRGRVLLERKLVGLYPDYRKSDYVGEEHANCPYPETMNEDTSILFKVDIKELRLFLNKKGLVFTQEGVNRIVKAIIYSVLYYYHRYITSTISNLEQYISDFEIMEYDYKFGDLIEDDEQVILRNSDLISLSPELANIICVPFKKYAKLVTKHSEVLYMSRVRFENKQYYFEIYAHSGYFDEESSIADLIEEEAYDKYMRENYYALYED